MVMSLVRGDEELEVESWSTKKVPTWARSCHTASRRPSATFRDPSVD